MEVQGNPRKKALKALKEVKKGPGNGCSIARQRGKGAVEAHGIILNLKRKHSSSAPAQKQDPKDTAKIKLYLNLTSGQALQMAVTCSLAKARR